jgi:hypothetical protein
VPPEPTSETRKKNITLNGARGRCRPRCARSGAPRPGARSALGAWQAAVPGERIYPAGTGSP